MYLSLIYRSCEQVYPIYSPSCSSSQLTISQSLTSPHAIVEVNGGASSGYKFKLILKIQDDIHYDNDDNINDYRWDMTSILITINNNDAMPDLSIFTNMSREGKSKMLLPTLNDKLKLYGLVRWPASDLMSTIARGRGVNITWSIDGLSASDLSSIALTPTYMTLTQDTFDDSNEMIIIYINLVLTPVMSVMNSRDVYTFRLSIIDDNDNNDGNVILSTTSIDFMRNHPPISGEFVVLPKQGGTELNTLYQFSSTLWTDNNEDMPLLYKYIYLVGKGSNDQRSILIHHASAKSMVSSYLSSDYSNNDNNGNINEMQYRLTCRVLVYDAYNAFSHKDTDVQVIPLYIANNWNSLQEATYMLTRLSQLTSSTLLAAKSIPYMISVYSSVGSTIARVICSSSPDCAVLNRHECYDIPNTCGKCLDGYIGISGDDNSTCTSSSSGLIGSSSQGQQQEGSLTSLLSSLSSSSSSSSCTQDSDCSVYEYCHQQSTSSITSSSSSSSSSCIPRLKTCINSCSNRGTCMYEYISLTSIYTTMRPKACTILEKSCQAVCVCEYSYEGSYCQYSQNELNKRKSLLLNVLEGFQEMIIDNVINDDDNNNDAVIKSLLLSMNVLPLERSLYTQGQITLLATISKYLGQKAVENLVAYDDIRGIQRAIGILTDYTMVDNTNDYQGDNRMIRERPLTSIAAEDDGSRDSRKYDHVEDSVPGMMMDTSNLKFSRRLTTDDNSNNTNSTVVPTSMPSSSPPSSTPSAAPSSAPSLAPSLAPSSSAPSFIPTMMPTITNIQADRQHVSKLLSEIYAQDMVPGQSPITLVISPILNYTFHAPMLYGDNSDDYNNIPSPASLSSSLVFSSIDGTVTLPFKKSTSPKFSIARYPAVSSPSSSSSSSSLLLSSFSAIDDNRVNIKYTPSPQTAKKLLSSYPTSAWISDVIQLQIDDMNTCDSGSNSDDHMAICLSSHTIQYYQAVNISYVHTVVHTLSCQPDNDDVAGDSYISFTCPGSSTTGSSSFSGRNHIQLDCGTHSGKNEACE